MSARTYPILENVIKYFPNHSHVYVTSTTGGTHATTSYHYRGEAIDVGSSSQVYKDQLGAWLYKYSGHITELLHTKAGDTGGWYVKNGVRKPHGWYGGTLDRAHINHCHLAVATVSGANALLAAVKKDYKPPASTTYQGHPTLLIGATGAQVKILQTLLNKHGAKLSVDSQFGNATYRAVAAFQKSAKIRVDGHVGPITWSKLLA